MTHVIQSHSGNSVGRYLRIVQSPSSLDVLSSVRLVISYFHFFLSFSMTNIIRRSFLIVETCANLPDPFFSSLKCNILSGASFSGSRYRQQEAIPILLSVHPPLTCGLYAQWIKNTCLQVQYQRMKPTCPYLESLCLQCMMARGMKDRNLFQKCLSAV